LVGRELAVQGEEGELAVRVASAELADPAVPAVRAALAVPENLVVLVAPGDPVVLAASVVPENPVALERDLAVVEPELVPVVAAPGLGHLHDQLGVPRRTKSATEAHHRGQARLLAVEDLAAVVETTRDPAATEAAVAWVAAVTAVADTVDLAAVVAEDVAPGWVVAAAAEEAAVVAAEDAEGKSTVHEEKTNEIKNRYYDFVESFRDCLRDR
jgi:hypothetical protein